MRTLKYSGEVALIELLRQNDNLFGVNKIEVFDDLNGETYNLLNYFPSTLNILFDGKGDFFGIVYNLNSKGDAYLSTCFPLDERVYEIISRPVPDCQDRYGFILDLSGFPDKVLIGISDLY